MLRNTGKRKEQLSNLATQQLDNCKNTKSKICDNKSFCLGVESVLFQSRLHHKFG